VAQEQEAVIMLYSYG